jgi:hypothetical protein
LGPFVVFHPKKFLLVLLFFSLIKFSALACFFLHNPNVGFWETPKPRFFQLPKGCFGVPINFFPHLLWGDRFHFHRGHCSFARNVSNYLISIYLENWVFIALIIGIKFLFNYHFFSLEMIGINSFDLLMLQAHLRLAWEFLPLEVACVPPFGQFVNKGVNSLQENILDKFHDNFFSNIIFNMASESHHVHLMSYASSWVSAWFFVHSIFFLFSFGLRCFLLYITN